MESVKSERNTGREVLKDVSVPWQLRLRRCQALLHVARREGAKALGFVVEIYMI